MAQRAASTQSLQKEYLAQKMREQRKESVWSAVTHHRGTLFIGLVVVGLAAALVVGVGLGGNAQASSRTGVSKGTADATAHAAAGKLILHIIDGAEVCPVADGGAAWQKAMRERFGVNVVRLRSDAVPPGDWAGYFRAYNQEMVKAIVARHGANVFERASKPGPDR